MNRILMAAAALVLSGCVATGIVTPLNPEAQQLGVPTVEFTKTGLDYGPVKITMPNGETPVESF
jgi:hypothetical protein